MSITRPEDEKPGQQKPAEGSVFGSSFGKTAGAQQAGTAQQSGTTRPLSARGGVDRMLALRSGMGRKRPAADLEALLKSFEEEFAGFTNSQNIREAQNAKLIMIDRNRLKKKVDVLAAILPVVIEGQTHMAIHTMLLEDANDSYDPAVFQIAGQQKRYTTVVGDVYDQDLFATIVQATAEASGLSFIPYDAGHQTLPAELDVKDKNAVHMLAFFASEALVRTALQSILKSTDDIVSLADFGDNIVASAHIDFRNVDDTTAAGLPLISDWSVKLKYSEAPRQGDVQNKAFDLGSSQPLGGSEGYIDLSYQAPAPAAFGQQQLTQHYWAQVILTRLDTDQDFITPELQLLSLLGSTLMGRNLNWARNWSQSFRGLNPGLKDIGAIGYELPGPDGQPLGRIETTTSAFDDAQLARLVMQFIHEKPIFMIDVEESGELTWLNRVFLDAAEGSQEAESSIIQALDNLTAGQFSPRWDRSKRLVVDTGNRIHLGYYEAEEGRRDVRSLNYLAVLNRYAELDPQMIEKFQATYDDTNIDAAVRLADREDLIRKILGPTVRFTGYARRLAFHPDLLDAALDAAADAGLRIRPENTVIGFGQTAARGRQGLAELAFGGQGGRQVFTAGPTGGAGGRAFGRSYTGRGSWR